MSPVALLVRTVRVVRGSRNSKGVSVVIFTAKCAKTANKKGSASGSLSSTLRKVCRKGSALNPGQQECFLSLPSYHRWLRKTCESLYWFAFPCSRRSRCSRFMILKRSVRCNFHRETRENRKNLYRLFFFVRTVRVVRGS